MLFHSSESLAITFTVTLEAIINDDRIPYVYSILNSEILNLIWMGSYLSNPSAIAAHALSMRMLLPLSLVSGNTLLYFMNYSRRMCSSLHSLVQEGYVYKAHGDFRLLCSQLKGGWTGDNVVITIRGAEIWLTTGGRRSVEMSRKRNNRVPAHPAVASQWHEKEIAGSYLRD